ncbi:hypothetical protein MRB53_039567 [Persea americana]|nr:hypothetical protein MRB53_039567 [Persea americana]
MVSKNLSIISLILSSLLATVATDSAPIVNVNPPGVQYIAVFPDKNDTTVRGAVQINSNSNGTAYHIHLLPAPTSLDCGQTGDQLDPYNAGNAVCDPSQPDKCQVGDLSGKHGNMTAASFSASYMDLYISTQPNTPAFIGNRSIVIQFANQTRITCANFTLSSGASLSASPVSTIVATAAAPTVAVVTSSTVSTAVSTLNVTQTVSTAPANLATTFVNSTVLSTLLTSAVISVPSVIQVMTVTQTATTTIATVSMLLSSPRTQSRSLNSTTTQHESTTTGTVVSVVYITPSLQTVSSNATATSTVVVPSTQLVAVPVTSVQTLISGVVQGQSSAVDTSAASPVQTVLVTVLSTSILSPGQTMQGSTITVSPPAQSVVTITPGSAASTITVGQSTLTITPGGSTLTITPSNPSTMTVSPNTQSVITVSPNTQSVITVTPTSTAFQSTVTVTSNTGNIISTIKSFFFGTTSVLVAPTTIIQTQTVTNVQTLPPSIITQIIQQATLPTNPAVATVVKVVSLAPSAVTNPGSIIQTLTMSPPIVSNVVSIVTANPLVSTITAQGLVPQVVSVVTAQPLLATLTQPLSILPKITATSILNLGLPILNNKVKTTTIKPKVTTIKPKITTLKVKTTTVGKKDAEVSVTRRGEALPSSSRADVASNQYLWLTAPFLMTMMMFGALRVW